MLKKHSDTKTNVIGISTSETCIRNIKNSANIFGVTQSI